MKTISREKRTAIRTAIKAGEMKKAWKVLYKLAHKNSLPVLNHVLVEGVGETTNFTATDLDVSVSIKLDIPSDVKCLFNSSFIRDALSSCKVSDPILITSKGKPELHCGKAVVPASIFSADEEWPPFPDMGEARHSFKVSSYFVSEANRCASKDDVRYILNGVFLDGEAGKIVATDGKRLIRFRGPLFEGNAIIPSVTAELMGDAIAVSSSTMNASVYERYATFSSDRTLIKTKLIDGNYPNYKQVVPRNDATNGGIWVISPQDKGEIVHFLKQNKDISKKKENQKCTLKCSMETGLVSIKHGGEKNTVLPELNFEGWVGDDVEIAFNPNLLVPFLEHVSDIQIRDPLEPIIALHQGEIYGVLMPLRK